MGYDGVIVMYHINEEFDLWISEFKDQMYVVAWSVVVCERVKQGWPLDDSSPRTHIDDPPPHTHSCGIDPESGG